VTIPGNKDWIYVKFVYAVVFCLLNASLGFQIFIVYILIAKSRRKILRTKLGSVKHSSSKRDSEVPSTEVTTGGSTESSKENSFDRTSASQSASSQTEQVTIDDVVECEGDGSIKL